MSSERSALLHNKDKISVSQMTQTPPPPAQECPSRVFPPGKGPHLADLGLLSVRQVGGLSN